MRNNLLKRSTFILAALCLAAGLLAGCGGSSGEKEKTAAPEAGETAAASQAEEAGGKTMVIGDTTFNAENWEETVDPHRTYNGWACIRYGIGETLVHYTDTMELEPWLAKSWENDGDLTWTITLQDNVYFSSGRLMDGEAVKECLEHLIANHDRAPEDTKIKEIKAEGQVLTITTSEPNPALMNYLGDPYGCIIDVQASDFEKGIVAGTGPYVVVDMQTDHHLTLTKNDNFQFSSIDTSRAFFASMNMTSPVIQDPAVRKAIAMGINKEGFVSTLLEGHGQPGNGAFPDGFSTFGGENVKTETYDPEGAAKVLEEAGWKDTDGDGIREKDGKKLTIRWLTYPSRQELPLLAESAQASLKDIGIELDINCTANRRDFLAKMESWDIYASALVTAPSGDPQYFFTTSCLPGMSYNFGAYENAEVTDLIEKMSTEFDPAERGKLAIELQQKILDDNAYVFCSFLQMNMISRAGVTGYTAHACDYYQVTADLDIE